MTVGNISVLRGRAAQAMARGHERSYFDTTKFGTKKDGVEGILNSSLSHFGCCHYPDFTNGTVPEHFSDFCADKFCDGRPVLIIPFHGAGPKDGIGQLYHLGWDGKGHLTSPNQIGNHIRGFINRIYKCRTPWL